MVVASALPAADPAARLVDEDLALGGGETERPQLRGEGAVALTLDGEDRVSQLLGLPHGLLLGSLATLVAR
jgi:hypothetical protein